jgi:Helix-turn-helix domain
MRDSNRRAASAGRGKPKNAKSPLGGGLLAGACGAHKFGALQLRISLTRHLRVKTKTHVFVNGGALSACQGPRGHGSNPWKEALCLMKSLSEALHSAALPSLKNSTDSTLNPRRKPGLRRQQVEAEHRVEIERAYFEAAQRARSHEDLEALDRAYQARMSQGPDFTRFRRKSDFGAAPPHGLDREAIHKLRHQFNSMARGAWEAKKPSKHRGIITRTCKDVFGALLFLAEQHTQLFPSFERLARLAQCCRKSVATSLDTLEKLGFITRHRRLRYVWGPLGRKAEQTTNGYELHLPCTAWGKLTLAVFTAARECKKYAATVTEGFQYLRGRRGENHLSALTGAYGGPP